MSKVSATSDRVQRYAHTQTAIDVFYALTHPELLDSLEAELPTHRQRLFPPAETLSLSAGAKQQSQTNVSLRSKIVGYCSDGVALLPFHWISIACEHPAS